MRFWMIACALSEEFACRENRRYLLGPHYYRKCDEVQEAQLKARRHVYRSKLYKDPKSQWCLARIKNDYVTLLGQELGTQLK